MQQIRRGLAVMKGLEIETIKIEDLIFDNHWRYLDVAFLDGIWKQWKLSKIFPQSDSKDVQTSEILKILTLYRCLDPGSYFSAVDWFNKTALDRILHINGHHINKSRIFRELDIIEDKKEDIERFLYKTLKKRDKDGMHIVFYDLTDSYFEGRKCELASAGRTKSNGFRKKRREGSTEDDLIRAYRDKNQIEQAFKEVKSFIKIQPFNVWTPKHVRSHYTICILSYLLDITIANRLKEVDIGVRSPQKVYEVLKNGIIGKITMKSTGDEFPKLMSLQSR